jgi:menaquinone-dependent protoporphyrinogen IX oxidase
MDESRDRPRVAPPDPAAPASEPEPGAPPARTGAAAGGRLLLVYASRHGSTLEVADAVAEELRAGFAAVDVREAKAAPPPAGYDAVVAGAPMIMGWHRDAEKYVRRHRDQLAGLPFAVFVTAASLTEDGLDTVRGVPVAKDPWLVRRPKKAGKPSRKERYALPSHYVGDVLDACAPARPRSVALFAGSLDLTSLNVLEKLFVLLAVGATPGDGRHFEFVREWAAEAGATLSGA